MIRVLCLCQVPFMRNLALSLMLLAAAPALAAFDPIDPRPDLDVIKAQIEAGDPGKAITPLRDWLVTEPKDADALNLLGYAYRKLGRYDEARVYYDRALTEDPAHLGALEYLGELELETGNADAARALLVNLRAACPDGCLELDDLLEAFRAHNVDLP